MDHTAPVEAHTPPPTPGQRKMADAVLVAFCLYVVAIYILALDQNLHWGLFPPTSDKQITAKILQLGDTSLSKEKRDELEKDLISWNTFAVPPLLKAIEKDPPAVRDPALKLLQTIALKYYNVDITQYGSDPAKLKQWWAALQADWAKTAAEKKP